MSLDPASAALYAIIAIAFIVVGWTVSSSLAVVEQGSVLAAVVAVLIGIGWRLRRRD